MRTESPKPRDLFLASLLVVSVFFTLLYSFQNKDLALENTELMERAKRYEKKIELIKRENRTLIERTNLSRRSMKEALDQLKSECESIRQEISAAQERANAAAEEKTYLEDILIHKDKQMENIKQGLPTAASDTPAASPAGKADARDVSERLKQKDAEINRLIDQNKILAQKLERLYKTTSEKISEINVAKIALEETVSQARRKIEDEWNTVDLGSISVDKGRGGSARTRDAKHTPKKTGRILAINEDHGFVVIDLGRADNLKDEAEFIVTRGSRPIGSITILEVRDVMSACNVQTLENGQQIKINDTVTLKR